MWLEVLLLCALLLVYAVLRDRRPRNCPPGPTEIPFFGRMPFFDEVVAEELKKNYGDIVMYRTGSYRSVLLFDYHVAKEALARLEFADRPNFFESFNIDDQKTGGVVSSNGRQWQHDRRFVLRSLRDLGMGKSYLEEAINIEAKALVEDLRLYRGKPVMFPDSFRTAALNIIWQMVASTRYDLRSKEVELIYELTKDFQRNFSVVNFIPMFIPALDKVPDSIKNKIFGEDLFQKVVEEMRNVVRKTIDEHLKDHDPDHPRDLIDEYIKEMELNADTEGSLFRRGALDQIVNDMFQAGSDTINNVLKWVVHLLARYPDVAQRMQDQIDSVVPRDAMVSLNDKPSLPLVEAFVMETLRYSSLLPINVQRAATRDTTIGGYFIPKGTLLVAGNYSIHFDPRYWTDPQRFNPDRFLDPSGRYEAPKAGFMAFGSGRRQCAGEVLARMELFLFTAAIAQNFDVMPPPTADLRRVKVATLGGLRAPEDHELIYRPRIYTQKN